MFVKGLNNMANNYEHNSNDLTTEFQSAPSYLKDEYKINFKSSGTYEQSDDVMIVKSGVTALSGSWFTAAHPLVRYQINSVPRPFVRNYGACIPNTDSPDQTLTSNTKRYWRWHNNYIQSSSNSSFSSPTNEKQSYSGLMFMEIQGGGGGGGGGDYTNIVGVGQTYASGAGGGGGAYVSVLVDLSKFSYIDISAIGGSGSGGGKNASGGSGGNTSVTFYYKSSGSHTFTAYGGSGGGGGTGSAGSGSKTSPEVCSDVTGIKVLRYFYGKGGGTGGRAISAAFFITGVTDGDDGDGFISTDTRYFGEIVDSVNIEGGANNEGFYFGGAVVSGGGGAAGLSKKGYGGGGHGGSVTWTYNDIGAVKNYTCKSGASGGSGCVLLYY